MNPGLSSGTDVTTTIMSALTTGAMHSASIETKQPSRAEQIDKLEDVLSALADIWLDASVQEAISEDQWNDFIEQIETQLDFLIRY